MKSEHPTIFQIQLLVKQLIFPKITVSEYTVLQRIGQTKTVSFQFIAIMSVIGLTTGINSIVFLTLMIQLNNIRNTVG